MNLKKIIFTASVVILAGMAIPVLLPSTTAYPLAAQTSQPQNAPPAQAEAPSSQGSGNSSQQAPTTPAQRRRTRNACLVHAGISKDLMDKRMSIMQQTRSQIETICGDSSLADADKKTQVRQARQDARKQIADEIAPEQEKAIESCDRDANLPTGEGNGNPCRHNNLAKGNAPSGSARNNPPNANSPNGNPADSAPSQP